MKYICTWSKSLTKGICVLKNCLNFWESFYSSKLSGTQIHFYSYELQFVSLTSVSFFLPPFLFSEITLTKIYRQRFYYSSNRYFWSFKAYSNSFSVTSDSESLLSKQFFSIYFIQYISNISGLSCANFTNDSYVGLL